ncbi:MAG: type 2 isopentenyl-diphosphate Delta-isomerase [Chloroflexi bacterium]|nr:type 2 isopentenyl-diphosphate Delta-isomerase [Chloroflexota bacterium]
MIDSRDGADARAEISARKGEHLSIIAGQDVASRTRPGWDDIKLIHQALPEIDLDEIDLTTPLLGFRLRAPLVIASMTGGHPDAYTINQVLAKAAQAYGLAMGVGSQRAALRDPHQRRTYAVARQEAPDAFLIGNIGAPQLIPQHGAPGLTVEEVRACVEMVQADALAVHLNILEEAVMPEGDRQARGVRDAITALVSEMTVPLIGKETGAGLSTDAALALRGCGVQALDVGGLGGTSFAAVEGARAALVGDRRGIQLGEVFRDWGIPTAVSVTQAAPAGLPIIATGGVRTGLDAARAIALGATAVGVARPLLMAALQGYEAVAAWIEQFLIELRTAMFLTGSRTPPDLCHQPRVIVGETGVWLGQLVPRD